MIWKTIYNEYSSSVDKKCFHIYNESMEDGLLYRQDLNLSFVENIEEADLILACTPFVDMTSRLHSRTK